MSTHQLITDSTREGNVFTRVHESVHGGPYPMMHWE